MNPINTAIAGATSPLPTSKAQADADEQYTSFLRLLTAQVRNQDPLSPLDSTQFVQQLATFSSLEQQVRSNASLDNIALGIGNLQELIAGQTVTAPFLVESVWLPHEGSPVDFTLPMIDAADQAVLSVRDRNGSIVASRMLDLASTLQTWDGTTNDGTNVPAGGMLQFSIDLYRDSQYAGSVAPQFTLTGSGS